MELSSSDRQQFEYLDWAINCSLIAGPYNNEYSRILGEKEIFGEVLAQINSDLS